MSKFCICVSATDFPLFFTLVDVVYRCRLETRVRLETRARADSPEAAPQLSALSPGLSGVLQEIAIYRDVAE
jgi:hypothetical protein